MGRLHERERRGDGRHPPRRPRARLDGARGRPGGGDRPRHRRGPRGVRGSCRRRARGVPGGRARGAPAGARPARRRRAPPPGRADPRRPRNRTRAARREGERGAGVPHAAGRGGRGALARRARARRGGRRDLHELVHRAELRRPLLGRGTGAAARGRDDRVDRADHRGHGGVVRADDPGDAGRVHDPGARARDRRALLEPCRKEWLRMAPPIYRPRRLRDKALLRKMVRETALSSDDLIYPLFVVHGRGLRQPIAPMPGQYRLSVDEVVKEAKDAASMGIPAVLLFGIPEDKDPRGSEAYADEGIVQQATRAIKDTVPDLLVITDVCLCEYTSHGHCGVVEDGRVKNDPTLELLARTAVSHAEAGADLVAPSDMMDGRVAAIREALDEASFGDTPIMAYSAKYASCFFEPFRAAGQLGWLDEERAMLEALTSIRRAGADIVITYFARQAARLLERGLGGR